MKTVDNLTEKDWMKLWEFIHSHINGWDAKAILRDNLCDESLQDSINELFGQDDREDETE